MEELVISRDVRSKATMRVDGEYVADIPPHRFTTTNRGTAVLWLPGEALPRYAKMMRDKLQIDVAVGNVAFYMYSPSGQGKRERGREKYKWWIGANHEALNLEQMEVTCAIRLPSSHGGTDCKTNRKGINSMRKILKNILVFGSMAVALAVLVGAIFQIGAYSNAAPTPAPVYYLCYNAADSSQNYVEFRAPLPHNCRTGYVQVALQGAGAVSGAPTVTNTNTVAYASNPQAVTLTVPSDSHLVTVDGAVDSTNPLLSVPFNEITVDAFKGTITVTFTGAVKPALGDELIFTYTTQANALCLQGWLESWQTRLGTGLRRLKTTLPTITSESFLCGEEGSTK